MRYTSMVSRKGFWVIGLAVVLLFLSSPVLSQNTKGDKPVETRETRFKKTGKKTKVRKEKNKKVATKTTNRRTFFRARKRNPGAERAAKPVTPLRTDEPQSEDRKKPGQSYGKRVGSRLSRTPQSARRNVVDNGRIKRRVAAKQAVKATRIIDNSNLKRKVISQSRRSKPPNIFPQQGRYVNNPSTTPRRNEIAEPNRHTLNVLGKLQGRDRKPGKKQRVVTRSASRSYTARRSINIVASYPRGRRKPEQAVTRDIAGRKVRTRNYETPGRKVLPADKSRKKSVSAREIKRSDRGQRFGNFRNYSSGKIITGTKKGKIVPRSTSARRRKIFPDSKFPAVEATQPRPVENAQSNKHVQRKLRLLQGRKPPGTGRKVTVVPRSATGSILSRRSTNMWANFPRPKKKSEQAVTRDIAGKKLRTKNFETPPREVITPKFKPYYGRKKPGDRAYKGPSGGYGSASKTRQKGWRGDIAGRSIRGIKKPRLNPRPGIVTGGYRSATRHSETRPGKAPLPVRQPGLGYAGMSGYRGFLKAKRQAKGGGSVSGRRWNNNGIPLNVRRPPARAAAVNGYPGKMRMFQGQPGFIDQGEEYTGAIKAKKPLKGGGSVSGKIWNNKTTPIPVRTPASGYDRIGRFQGNIKAGKPLKGGGSVSGKIWNNKETPIPVRTPASGYDRIGQFQGHVKASKPLKGGGSVSGKTWNNKMTPIPVRTPAPGYDRIGQFQGHVKASKPLKGGGSVSGKLWNNNGEPIAVRTPAPGAARMDYAGNIKLSRFGRAYVKNPNASDLALAKRRPSKSVYDEDKLQTKIRQYNYIRNRSGATASNKVREPGKAFARASDYQGNIKMQKFDLFGRKSELHPDARFVKTNRNNVSGEKDPVTNFKLWWARLFRKGETQPDHLKEKGKKPRYDKREEGLWYD